MGVVHGIAGHCDVTKQELSFCSECPEWRVRVRWTSIFSTHRLRPTCDQMNDGSQKTSGRSKLVSGPSLALTAVALQDHLSQRLSLSLPPAGPRKPLNSGCRTCGKTTRSQRRARNGGICQASMAPTDGRNADKRLCDNCSARRLSPAAPTTKSVALSVHSQKNSLHTTKINELGREYVLDPCPPPFTLAQKLGLVEAPRALLTEQQWGQVKAASNARQDSCLPCPICKEQFGMREQVLLSCSHVFHRVCLGSLERYSRRKCCPLCRTEGYQTRVIFEGASHCRTTAATKIQAVWRGYVTRRWYRDLHRYIPPQDPVLRQRYFEEKLSTLTDSVVRSCESSASGAERVLAQADTAMANARDVMRTLDLHSELTHSTTDWKTVHRKASEHATADCPVCLVPLLPSSTSPPPRPLSLLSCGHLLHAVCVHALEQYCPSSPHLCPLCRAPYQRQPFHQEPS